MSIPIGTKVIYHLGGGVERNVVITNRDGQRYEVCSYDGETDWVWRSQIQVPTFFGGLWYKLFGDDLT